MGKARRINWRRVALWALMAACLAAATLFVFFLAATYSGAVSIAHSTDRVLAWRIPLMAFFAVVPWLLFFLFIKQVSVTGPLSARGWGCGSEDGDRVLPSCPPGRGLLWVDGGSGEGVPADSKRDPRLRCRCTSALAARGASR